MASVSQSEAIQAIQSKGFQPGPPTKKHDRFYYVKDGKRTRYWVEFSRGSGYQTIGDELQSRMRLSLGLGRRIDVEELLNCTLDAADYEQRLLELGKSI
jgi:hypothetical protein